MKDLNQLIKENGWENTSKVDNDFIRNYYHTDMEDGVKLFKQFNLFESIAYSLCGYSAVWKGESKDTCKEHGEFNHTDWSWLCFGWGNPHITNEYGYCLFNFEDRTVTIEGTETTARTISFDEIIKNIL